MFDGENKTVEVTENAKNAVRSLLNKGAQKLIALNLVDLSNAPGIPDSQRRYIASLVVETNAVLR